MFIYELLGGVHLLYLVNADFWKFDLIHAIMDRKDRNIEDCYVEGRMAWVMVLHLPNKWPSR